MFTLTPYETNKRTRSLKNKVLMFIRPLEHDTLKSEKQQRRMTL